MSLDGASLTDWLATPPGRCLLDWETAQFEHAVSDIFGYHAVQLGFAPLDALASNRMPHRWLAVDNLEPPKFMPRTRFTATTQYMAPKMGHQRWPRASIHENRSSHFWLANDGA